MIRETIVNLKLINEEEENEKHKNGNMKINSHKQQNDYNIY